MGKLNSYRKLSQEVYDLTKPEPPDFVWPFYLGYAQRANGPILEPMCGSGRYLLPLLEAGFDVDGIDASADMLAACRERCAAAGFSPGLWQQFLHEMDLPRQYALAFIPAASIGLVTNEEEITASLQRLYEALLPGGTLVVEVETVQAKPETLNQWSGYWVNRPDGATIVVSILEQMSDEAGNIMGTLVKYELVANQGSANGRLLETEIETMDVRLHEPSDFAALLAKAGFVDIRCLKFWGEIAERDPDPKDPRVVFECRRP